MHAILSSKTEKLKWSSPGCLIWHICYLLVSW